MKGLTLTLAVLLSFLFMVNKSLAKLENSSFYTLEDFKALFLKEIKKELSWINGTLILENFRVEPENLKIPQSASFKTKFISSPKLGSNTLLVTFFLGKNPELVRIWGYVEAQVPVVVVKRPINAKNLLRPEDLALEERPLSRLPQDVVLDVNSVIGKQLKTSLKAGNVLRGCLIEAPMVVKKNSLVNIVAKNGKIIVKAQGKALQNGRVGEIIKIQNLSSKKVLLGKVVSSEEVEVSF
ncbi:MAG: flagellar basal body P-ring formation chaperone FlgA [Thermodesulfobacteriaceae bacterium]|nr:flagellar basal body P-ring formation chaperone FlgA [Thermodesulfobacteriaceae bacterium]